DVERIGLMRVEAEPRRDALGEERESAGNQRTISATRPHRGDQLARARHEAEAVVKVLQDIGIEAFEEPDTLFEGFLERYLAAHGTCRDLRYAVSESYMISKLIKAFLLNDGGLHVGYEQLLAPLGVVRHHVDVDGKIGESLSDGCADLVSIRGLRD